MEFTPKWNLRRRGDPIKILKNGEPVESVDDIPSDHTDNIERCFESFDVENDIIELKNTGNDGADISINLINDGVITPLEGFGSNSNLAIITIDGNQNACESNHESAPFIRIRNGKILESKCVGKLIIF